MNFIKWVKTLSTPLNKDNKRMLKYLCVLFIAVLITYKLPHDSYSIIQYIIKPIRHDHSVTHLSGIIPFILYMIGIRGIFNLERFANKSRIVTFLLIVVIIIPFMKWTLDFTRTNYHWIMKDGLNAVDINESKISLANHNDSNIKIIVKIELIDYGRSQNKFKIRVYLPKTLRENLGREYIELEQYYMTIGNRRTTLTVNEQIVVHLDDANLQDKIFDSQWYWEDTKYELYNDNEVVEIIDHGL